VRDEGFRGRSRLGYKLGARCSQIGARLRKRLERKNDEQILKENSAYGEYYLKESLDRYILKNVMVKNVRTLKEDDTLRYPPID